MKIKRLSARRVVALLLLSGLAGGCAANSGAAKVPQSVGRLDGTWHLAGYGPQSSPQVPLADAVVTLKFEHDTGQMTGSAGCNGFGGSYTIEGDTIEFGPIAATKKMCLEPDGVMKQETAILGALADAVRYELDGTSLTLHYGDDSALVFTSAPDVEIAGDDSTGLEPLGAFVGAYPRDVLFWGNPLLTPRLNKLLGDDMEAFLENIQVQGPISEEEGLLYVTGNKPHEGGSNMAAFLADPARDQIQVWLLVDGAARTYVERKPPLTNPPAVRKFIDNVGAAP